MSHYDTLGVDQSASKDDIKKAYRRKRSKAHPDHGGSKEEFHALVRAYEVLTDDARRDKYDKTNDDREQDPRSAILGEIAQTFFKVINQLDDVDHCDPFEMVRNHFHTKSENFAREIVEVTRRIKKLKKVLKRVKSKNQTIQSMIKADIKKHEDIIPMLEHNIQLVDQILTELETYSYDVEEVQTMRPGYAPMFSTSTT